MEKVVKLHIFKSHDFLMNLNDQICVNPLGHGQLSFELLSICNTSSAQC
jgi:hypothetical protein